MVDETFSLGSRPRRRYGQQWLNYLDDSAVRSGRWICGGPISDAAYASMLANAKPPAEPPRSLGDALDAAGLQQFGGDTVPAEQVDVHRPHPSTGSAATKGRGKSSSNSPMVTAPAVLSAQPSQWQVLAPWPGKASN